MKAIIQIAMEGIAWTHTENLVWQHVPDADVDRAADLIMDGY